MSLFVSVISHEHDHIIERLGMLARLSNYASITVILRDNVRSTRLRDYCKHNGIHYFENDVSLGFAENNNLNYVVALEMGLSDDDYFLLLNPDVDFSEITIEALLNIAQQREYAIVAPNLFPNEFTVVADDNLRRFPTFNTFIANYLLKSKDSVIDKEQPTDDETFWASGAFLVIKGNIYRNLNGLDENYFMYCEDVDFCFRALQEGIKVTYVPEIVAIHYRRNASRQFASKLFFHHVKSAVIFEMTRRNWRSLWHKTNNRVAVELSKKALLESTILAE